jgi:hypothetical protein
MSPIVLEVGESLSTDLLPPLLTATSDAEFRRDSPTGRASNPDRAATCLPKKHRFEVLLDDPPLACWAAEAAWRYEISPLQALELLADALAKSVVMNGVNAAARE